MSNFDTPEMLEALGNIESRNYTAALPVLMGLAEFGNPKAQCNLANLYHFGWGVQPDGEKAVQLYLKVAEQNIREEHLSGLAYNNLATIYITGLPGITPNRAKAADYSARAKDLEFGM
jgi:hypothetical protein